MTKAIFTQRGFVTRILYFNGVCLEKGRQLAEMYLRRGERVRVETL